MSNTASLFCDINTFDNQHKCFAANNEEIIESCSSLKRLMHALKYYSLLDISNSKICGETLLNFIQNIYHQFLDDFSHLIEEHQPQLHRIHASLLTNSKYGFIQCDMKSCKYTSRHHSIRDEDNINNNTVTVSDPMLRFCVEMMDSLHFYVFHLFDCGLRLISNANETTDSFEERKTAIYPIVATFDRFNNSTKFSINIQPNQNNNSETYLDELYTYLNDKKRENDCNYASLSKFLISEDFDTDTVEYDIIAGVGNILNNTKDTHCFASVKQFIQTTKLHSSSFNIGIIWYYWPYYEHFKQHGVTDNDHGGHSVSDLFIYPKYKDFKQEISNYKYISVTDYEKDIKTKAIQYLATQKVRKIKTGHRSTITDLHYGIKSDTVLSYNNLISLIMYTDYSDHSTDFSKSFRQIFAFEHIQSIKQRNIYYYWMSKTLRETVQIFGKCAAGKTLRDFDNGYLSGPFYTGISAQMVLPNFNIRLCSPTSTSCQLTVAVKFSGEDGIVIALNNPKDSYQHKWLTGFNCSWLSRYKEEDERLFFGGGFFIKMVSVRIRNTNQNFEEF
eukprot:292995_1